MALAVREQALIAKRRHIDEVLEGLDAQIITLRSDLESYEALQADLETMKKAMLAEPYAEEHQRKLQTVCHVILRPIFLA